ncbi:(d)CMP kinase [Desulfovibrio sp. OttesenSCG-928-O18]|nr:(d)CMP kinase [Desulfovibrio sp. OttesenSCG-928-O18]
MRRVITLDGPAGVGKSTLAKRVAEELGIAYLDTGAMFRTIAKTLGAEGLNTSEPTMETALAKLRFSLSGSGAATALSCNGVPTGREIRTEEVGMLASRYATLPAVRSYLKKAQQELGASYDLVAEGRDMGTAVFPDAPHKFFLDASPEVRAERRVKQLAETGVSEDIAEVTKRIKERDALDRGRALAPLVAAEDAVVIDTSHLDIQGVFDAIMRKLQ